MMNSEEAATAAEAPEQLAAARRRERILRNSENRMKLVTGKSEQLEQAPEKPLVSETETSKSSTPSVRSTKAPLFLFRWTARAILSFSLAVFWICTANLVWNSTRFIFGFIFVEVLIYSIRWVHLTYRGALRHSTKLLFLSERQVAEMDAYLDLPIIFLGIHGSRQNLFRWFVLMGMQSSLDFAVFLVVFAVSSVLTDII